jgi:phospholipid/cholesterol/gamma-HCH transport system ATP-binding protein
VPEQNVVEVADLSFAYDETRNVLSGISLAIPRGKVVAIMGGSGCGKTTLLRLIGGALRATKGAVHVFGRDVGELATDELFAMRRRMSMLFQFGALFTDMSTFDNVAFQMREHTQLPEPLIRDLVLMKLHAVGLRGAEGLMPSELSGGMARRVALARAIALDPEQLIRTLNDALGATSIVVTHDVQESLKIVDYIYFISEGRIIAAGTPAEVKASQAPFVHQFVWGEADGPVPFHYPAADYRGALLDARRQ